MHNLLKRIYTNTIQKISDKNILLRKTESGQVLFFFATIAMVLVILTGTITDYGLTLTQAVKAQTAADAAALSAAAWTARAGNLSQQVNGIHWDINYTLAQVITLSANIAMVVIIILKILSCIPYVGTYFSIAAEVVTKMESVLITLCSGIKEVSGKIFDILNSILTTGSSFLALIHANLSAANNGASSIEQLIINGIRNIDGLSNGVQSALSTVNDILEVKNDFLPGIHTYPISLISPLPWKAVKTFNKYSYPTVEEMGDAADGQNDNEADVNSSSNPSHNYLWTIKHPLNTRWANPYHIDTYAPFTAVNTFWQDLGKNCTWSDTFIVQPNQEFYIQSKITPPFIDGGTSYSGDSKGGSSDGFSLNFISNAIDAVFLPFEILTDVMFDLIGSVADSLFGSFADTLVEIFENAPCIYDDEKEKIIKSPIEDIGTFTFIVGVKSELGSFLKMFGPVIGEDPDRLNIPMTFALATAKVRGHEIRPGGLYKPYPLIDIYQDIQMLVVPFWISAMPFDTQSRLNPLIGYNGDMKARMSAVEIPRKPRGAITISKGDKTPTILKKLFKTSMTSKKGTNRKSIPGIIFGFNH